MLEGMNRSQAITRFRLGPWHPIGQRERISYWVLAGGGLQSHLRQHAPLNTAMGSSVRLQGDGRPSLMEATR